MITGYFTIITDIKNTADIAARLKELPEALQKKINSYNTGRERLSRLCGKLLLARILADNNLPYGLNNLRYNEFAKPYLDTTFDFNTAHSGDISACIVSTGYKVGIDIEKIADQDIEHLKENFTTREWDVINKSPDATQAFYTYWVRKEAVIKATGKGIFADMDEFDTVADEVMTNGQRYFLKDTFLKSGYSACIATDEIEANISSQEIDINDLLGISVKKGGL